MYYFQACSKCEITRLEGEGDGTGETVRLVLLGRDGEKENERVNTIFSFVRDMKDEKVSGRG